ncbi:MAG: phosphoribosylglycinamide formyltransferase [Gammaproteobacteria bacterium]|nr:MAG: phosphoribosylglycinamide formyltransferase [Gammaproteobacteria bacterium]
MSQGEKLRLVVLISGGGSNLQAIIDACREGRIDAEVVAVISNRPEAYGLQRAREAGIPAEIVDHTAFPDRQAFERELAAHIDRYEPDLVILAGFMRILTPGFVTHYKGRMLNIHPSLLPHFQGLHTHRRALEAGHERHGASVHFVTEELDGGPVVLQVEVPVLPGDDEQTLAARVLEQEHRIYPTVIQWFAEGRLRFDPEQGVLLDEEPLREPVRWSI